MSSDIQRLPGRDDYLEESTILSDLRQRRILSILLDRSRPMTDRELAVQLAAREAGIAPSDVTEKNHEQIRVDLHHRCLPKLEAVGWIERNSEGIIATDPPSFGEEDPSLPSLQDPDHPAWEAVCVLFAHPLRQDLVLIIASQRHRLTLEELATELPERGQGSWTTERRGDESTLLSRIHHVDLPKLAEVGLIEYDSGEKTIVPTRSLMTLLNQTDLDNR